MELIRTIDLWTEQLDNHEECFCGAFVDGFENGNIPFDSYKVVKNCNCIIKTNYPNLNISNKHQAIVFYKNNIPVRLMVINKNTNVDKCIEKALDQTFNNHQLKYLYQTIGIKRQDVNLLQPPIDNQSDHDKEIDVGSCDRPALLYSMLEGSYTQSESDYGKSNNDNNYSFVPNINIQYELNTGNEQFIIEHHCAFINSDMSRIIPLQDHSLLNIEEISSNYENNPIKK